MYVQKNVQSYAFSSSCYGKSKSNNAKMLPFFVELKCSIKMVKYCLKKTKTVHDMRVHSMSTRTGLLWRCSTKKMGGGQNRREIFNCIVAQRPGLAPDLPHAKRSPPAAGHDSQLLLHACFG